MLNGIKNFIWNNRKEIMDIIRNRKDLKDWLNYELKAYGKGGINNFFCITEKQILRKHQILLRKTEYYTNIQRKIIALFYKIRLYKIQNKYSLHIPINCCGKGLKIMHIGPILINDKAKIGNNCALHINTAIAAGGVDNNAPEIGDGVVIGVGAVLLGGIKVASNVAIGANAVVNKDVLEEDIAVAGVPARKISNNGRTKWNKNK